MKIDFYRLACDSGIHLAQVGEKHYRSGWQCLPCPFCSGHAGNHLGFNPEANVFTCFRCGRHGKFKVIAELLSITPKQAFELCKKYSDDAWTEVKIKRTRTAVKVKEKDFVVPGNKILKPMHINYLKGRDFNYKALQKIWDIRGTGMLGDLAYRLVVPITYNNKIVSYTTRDVTGATELRYLACSPHKAVRHHKHCVYGLDLAPYKTCIITEGFFGVWRIGKGCVCTLGIGFTTEQVELIAEKFTRSYVFFDPDELQARIKARKLSRVLNSYPTHMSEVINGSGFNGRDSGELTTTEIKQLRNLLK